MIRVGRLAVFLGLASIAAFAAHADSHTGDEKFTDYSKMTPSATMEFDVTSVKLIAGASWGTGTLHYQGKSHPLKVKSGSVGGIGYRSMKGTGNVYGLNKLEDFPGIYGGGTAGATVGTKGGGASTIENGKGVVIKATATDSSGAQLALSAGGIEIAFAEE